MHYSGSLIALIVYLFVHRPASNPQDQGPRPGKSIYTDHGKVNFICKVIRNEMMKYLDPLRSSEVKSISINALLHPILCTYAKQQPSLLAEALTTIGTVAATSTAITGKKQSGV